MTLAGLLPGVNYNIRIVVTGSGMELGTIQRTSKLNKRCKWIFRYNRMRFRAGILWFRYVETVQSDKVFYN